MIVCSKRAFLNVLTQLMDANTLLNANYYIADQASRNGIAQLSDNISMDGNGEFHLKSAVSTPMLNPYHILYDDSALSPISMISSLLVEQTAKSVDDMFREKLMTNDSLLQTYDFLYSQKAKGNGLRILMFVNDTAVPYLYIVCEYISSLFGEDIMFIDKQYRNDIRGQVQYKGDKARSVQVLKELRDFKMVKDIVDLMSTYQYGCASRNNVESFFTQFETKQLFYVYEKLFPSEPLKPGYYTREHIEHIIISKLQHAFPQQAGMSNLMIQPFADMSDLYNGISDEEMLETHE